MYALSYTGSGASTITVKNSTLKGNNGGLNVEGNATVTIDQSTLQGYQYAFTTHNAQNTTITNTQLKGLQAIASMYGTLPQLRNLTTTTPNAYLTYKQNTQLPGGYVRTWYNAGLPYVVWGNLSSTASQSDIVKSEAVLLFDTQTPLLRFNIFGSLTLESGGVISSIYDPVYGTSTVRIPNVVEWQRVRYPSGTIVNDGSVLWGEEVEGVE
jgi:hypothetical protein